MAHTKMVNRVARLRQLEARRNGTDMRDKPMSLELAGTLR